jgi:FKBP-type peptidyl-prolyl cis-trans isomerase
LPGVGIPLERLISIVEGADVGDTLLVELPPEYAYGAAGSRRPLVPPSINVVFEIEILEKLPEFSEIQSILDEREVQTTASGLEFVALEEGDGPSPTTRQDQVTTAYAGWLTDGTLFDANTFRFGVGRVISGWTEALLDMQVGETRVLRIPSDLAYGARGSGGTIPPNATLIFYVELLDVDRLDPFVEQKIDELAMQMDDSEDAESDDGDSANEDDAAQPD